MPISLQFDKKDRGHAVPLGHAGFPSCDLCIGSQHCSPQDRLQLWEAENYEGLSASANTQTQKFLLSTYWSFMIHY